MLFRTLILKASSWGPIKRLVTQSAIFRPTVRRFIAGDTAAEAMQVAENLAEQGFFVSLDYLGENVATAEEANRTTDAYIEVCQLIAASPQRDRINISIKLTALGMDQGDDLAEANYRKLLEKASESDTFVRADMEASEYTERTITMVERVFARFKNTGTVLQSYLFRTSEDVDRLIRIGCRVRMVKGAYLESEKVAYQDKAEVDRQYVDLSKRLMLRAKYPAIASHDAAIIDELVRFARSEKIDPSRFEFQMLYGIRRDLQASLKEDGFNVRVYIPYGESWYPYFSRRLAERPANIFFIAKSMFRK